METDKKRRRILTLLTGGVAGAGIVGVSIPFISSLKPAKDKVFQTVEVDITKLQPGQMVSVVFDNKPVYILKRTHSMLKQLAKKNVNLADADSDESKQPGIAKNYYRSVSPDVLVAYSMCTHLGCAVSYNPPGENVELGEIFKEGVFFCPCHGAVYDLSGRVYKGMPAPYNLEVPNYKIIDEKIIEISRGDNYDF